MAKLKQHLQEREALKDTIVFLQNEVAAHTAAPLDEFTVDALLETASTLKADIILIHKKIMLNSPADPDVHTAEYHTLLKNATTVHCQLHGIKIKFPKSTTTPNPGPSSADVRLPRLELPTFDGDLSQWVSFRDIFTTTIHNNAHISKAQKLTYLKTALKDEAARLVQSMIISDSNYDIAWDQLTSRYQNDREILFAILRKFNNQPQISGNSSTAIRTLIDTSTECMRSLEVLSLTIDPAMDAFMMFNLYNKLDTSSKQLWEQGLSNSSIPKLQTLFNFLEQRARALAAGEQTTTTTSTSNNSSKGNSSSFDKRPRTHHVQTRICFFCKSNDHYMSRCSKFLSKPEQERNDTVRKLKLCFNCLREGHSTTDCLNPGRCFTCNRKHHTLIHIPNLPSKTKEVTESHHTGQGSSAEDHPMLATAIIKVKDIHGQTQLCRALLDGCSSSSYISESCAQRLQLQRRSTTTQILGLSSVPVGTARGIISLDISSHFNSKARYTTEAFVISKVTGQQPSYPRDDTFWTHVRGITLADPQYNLPRNCDILLGAEIFYTILLNGKRKGSKGTPYAINSTLGWLVAGSSSNKMESQGQVYTHHTENIHELMQKFWELRELPEHQLFTEEEAACEEHFKDTVDRDTTGRFTVQIPWKTPTPPLGPSKEMAVRRLKSLEKRLETQPELQKQYAAFFKEYEERGHMKRIQDPDEICNSRANYIPHHYVLKESSTTTKYRSVFDASAKTSTGNSLNSTMMVGPVIQAPLLDTLLRFRPHAIAFTADIEKMYRQIQVAPQDAVKQRILFREKASDPIQIYQLNTVTYGTAAAPYLATRVLQELAQREEKKYPLGARTVRDNMYIDDLMHGGQDMSQALEIQQQTTKLLDSAGFPLRKWASNSKEFLSHVPEDFRETNSTTPIELGQTVKTLGVFWNTTTDNFNFSFTAVDTTSPPTKRSSLSYMAKIYDPLGWLAPMLVTAKIFIQSLWSADLDWDTPLPESLTSRWSEFKNQLTDLHKINIPRCIRPGSPYFVGLAGFADASTTAYCACTYMCCYYHNAPPSIKLINATTRVAPLKTVTLPRLELCAALELAILISKVKKALRINFNSIRAWSDSTVTLCWIQSHPSRWKQFVSHRVAEIQQHVPGDSWRHVPGEENPADCGSRGITTAELLNHHLWWEGPSWLKNIDSMKGDSKSFKGNLSTAAVKKEEKKVTFANLTVQADLTFLLRFSSLHKLLRSTAWLRRYFSFLQAKARKCPPKTGILTTAEIRDAHQVWILKTQQEFSEEITALQCQQQLHWKSKILTLSPFLDKQGQLRVGGRLHNAPVTPDMKTPILLPRHHPFTKLLLQTKHRDLLHAGAQLMQSAIQQQYWIPRARDAIRQVVRSCTICVRHRATTMQHMMGNLPSTRVTPTRPFQRCGVDYAGPFTTRAITGRSKITYKTYLCIFVCFVTHAVHLELVTSMTTKGFLAAFKRFIGRRGIPADIHSDCGTNFVGANKELQQFSSAFKAKLDNLQQNLSVHHIQWHFNPPAAPHFGGLWEAAVKAVKFHLYRVVGLVRLTYEELSTIMVQIEACLNSRPLTPMSSDPADLSALTPGHFLIGQPLTAVTEPDVTNIKIGRLDRWQMMTHLTQHFWKRWVNEYLSTLQKRTKWTSQKRNVEINDMVLIKHENSPPLYWKLGRVIALHPGADNVVRVVTVRTAEGEVKRPVVKLCQLPVDSNDVES